MYHLYNNSNLHNYINTEFHHYQYQQQQHSIDPHSQPPPKTATFNFYQTPVSSRSSSINSLPSLDPFFNYNNVDHQYNNNDNQISPKRIKLPSISDIKLKSGNSTAAPLPLYHYYQPPIQQQLQPSPPLIPPHYLNSSSSPPLTISTVASTIKRTTHNGDITHKQQQQQQQQQQKVVKKLVKKKLQHKAIHPLDDGTTRALFFPKFQINEDFIIKHLKRDYALDKDGFLSKYGLDDSYDHKDSNEIMIDELELIRWKAIEFFLDYLKLNDIRKGDNHDDDDKKDEESEDYVESIDLKNVFEIDIKFELLKPSHEETKKPIGLEFFQTSQDSKIEEQHRYNLRIHLKVLKPNDSKLDKMTILETLKLNLWEFLLNYNDEINIKTGKKKRKLNIKPKWGLGYKDELSILDMKVEIE